MTSSATTVAAGALLPLDVELLKALAYGSDGNEGLSCPRIAHVRAEMGHPFDVSLSTAGARLTRMVQLGLLDRYRRRGEGSTRRFRLTTLGAETLAELLP